MGLYLISITGKGVRITLQDSKKRKTLAEVILLLLAAHFALGSLMLEKNMLGIVRVFQVTTAMVTSMLWWNSAMACGKKQQIGFLLFGTFVLLICHLPDAVLSVLSWQTHVFLNYVRYYLFFLPLELLRFIAAKLDLPSVLFIDFFMVINFILFFIGTADAKKEHRNGTPEIV